VGLILVPLVSVYAQKASLPSVAAHFEALGVVSRNMIYVSLCTHVGKPMLTDTDRIVTMMDLPKLLLSWFIIHSWV